ncbi:family 16 glycoside hydrolase [Streptosporangium sp. NPDC000396]|uniref:family 16 glycoside hydrolase n=1 Tax=Streptosporangium sp. NPDC000396 TaxID=3366185 RepID=UPI003678AF5E
MSALRRGLERAVLAPLTGLAVVASAFAVSAAKPPPDSCVSWRQGTVRGGLLLQFDGYGTASACRRDGEWLWRLSPKPAHTPDETHAALAVTTATHSDLELRVRARTPRQLRLPAPNPWEVAWMVWHYTDNHHFYYLILKPNGWELGKVTPGYPGGQRFLATGNQPYDAGLWHTIEIRQVADTITADVNGCRLIHLRDLEHPYRKGQVGIYTEDATADFTDLRVRPVVPHTDQKASGRGPGRSDATSGCRIRKAPDLK